MSITLDTCHIVPDEYINYFYERLSNPATLGAIFQGQQTEVELIVCHNQLRVRTQLTRGPPTTPSRSLRAPHPTITPPEHTPPLAVASPPPPTSSQQYGTEVDERAFTELDTQPGANPAGGGGDATVQTIDLGDPTHTVTNRNRRKERQRALQRQQKLDSVVSGRVSRSSALRQTRHRPRPPRVISHERVSESDEDADAELTAREDNRDGSLPRLHHSSLIREVPDTQDQDVTEDELEVDAAVLAKDSSTDSQESVHEPTSPRSLRTTDPVVTRWFRDLRVPKEESAVLVSVPLSSALQQTMLDFALAIAGAKSAAEWQTYFAAWRKSGGLASRPVSRDAGLQKHLEQYPTAVQHFYHSYNRVETSMVTDMWRAITHRFAMKDLWAAFQTAVTHVRLEDLPPARTGAKLITRQRQYLFLVLHPELVGYDLSKPDKHVKSMLDVYGEQLKFAKRWHTLAETLGMGVLGLIPNRVVSNHWIQKKLRVPEFAVWLQVIRQWNPRVIEASQHWEKTLRKALAHHRPPRNPKLLETISAASLKRFHDPTTLFRPENGETDVSGDEQAGGVQAGGPSVPQIAWESVGEQDFGLGECGGLAGLDPNLEGFNPGFNLEWMDLSGVYPAEPASSGTLEQRSSQ